MARRLTRWITWQIYFLYATIKAQHRIDEPDRQYKIVGVPQGNRRSKQRRYRNDATFIPFLARFDVSEAGDGIARPAHAAAIGRLITKNTAVKLGMTHYLRRTCSHYTPLGCGKQGMFCLKNA